MQRPLAWQDHLIGVSAELRGWLADQGSLTRRISQHCADFQVSALKQWHSPAFVDEAAMVGLAIGQNALLREVYLNCGTTPVVFAHSVLPRYSLTGSWATLAKLGNHPLGAALFADPRVRRCGLQFRRLDSRHALYFRATAGIVQAPPFLWARRSLFMLAARRILVTEVFLPEVFKL